MSAAARARQAALVTWAVLVAVYGATAAPSLTLWDAGEFATAIATFGIPHPPGTPLYVTLGAAVWGLLPMLSPVQAGTLVSILATATACAVMAWLAASVSARRSLGICAGVSAGAMGSVWLSATETEVYGVALLSMALQLLAAWRAHQRDDDRARVLLAYVAALSVPLHLSALVATPAALFLANTDRSGRVRPFALIGSAALVLATIAISRAQLWLAGVSLLLAITPALVVRMRAIGAGRDGPRAGTGLGWLVPACAAMLLAWSAIAILLVRARHGPFLNQGDPDTIARLLDVVSRAQYDVASPWPRRAPLWLQVGNIVQYADWQVALSFWNDVTPDLRRTPFTVLAAALGVAGATAHWRAHRITARTMLLLFALATLGVCWQLNLRAGPSFGIGVLPAWAAHEARERDYFYALAFWIWGAWIGAGAVVLARRLRARPLVAGVVPMAMLAGNWSAVARNVDPDRRLTQVMADEFLHDVPRHGLLLTAGDNDTYPLWYRQAAHGIRPDVRVVVTSLLPADWYLVESAARIGGALSADTLRVVSSADRAAALARAQLARGGAVAVSSLIDSGTRDELGHAVGIRCWFRAGLVDIAVVRDLCPPRIDGARTAASAVRLQSFARDTARTSPDGMVAAFLNLARCPALVTEVLVSGVAPRDSSRQRLLDLTCNLR
ncbi:MAG TPA: DUF2723 domain-containing protein [Gemmatimonadaceae bacterium]|nr:DUF2723 domain-containing protein [Gemmatimonadaceae bacterium]